MHENQKYTPTMSKGIIMPHTDGFHAEDFRFYDFPEGTALIETCSECYHNKKWHNKGNINSVE